MHFRKNENRLRIVSAVVLVIVPSLGLAQGLSQDERGVTAISTPGYRDHRNSSSNLLTPLVFNYNYSTSSGDGASAAISQSASADFGNLSESTTGSAQSSAGYGDFVWSSTAVGGAYTLSFNDTITANETMDIAFDYHIVGTGSFVNNADGGSNANTTWLLSSASYFQGDQELNGSMDLTGVWHLTAGQQQSFTVGLGWDCSANSNDLNGRFSSFSQSATGLFTLNVLTAGATYSSLSGHGYSQAVPEPSALPLLVLGLTAFGCIRARR